MGELFQYRTAGMLALGVDMRAITSSQSLTNEVEAILGGGIA